MLVTMFDSEGKAIAVNPSRVMFARNSRTIGCVELVMEVYTLMNGQQVVMQLAVKGGLGDVTKRLNLEPLEEN